ncbi:hypothetical protein JCM3765_007477 [Sporobolomyces pararoseus]
MLLSLFHLTRIQYPPREATTQIKRVIGGYLLGYDTELFVKVEDWAVCNICHDILEDPTLSGCAGEHLFCAVCITESPYRNGCPTCRGATPQAARKRSVLANRLIQNFSVTCERSGAGCKWIGPLSNMTGHNNSCDFRPHPCPKIGDGCAFTGTTQQLTEHTNSTCPFVNVNCPRQCGFSYKRHKEKEHEDLCNAWPCTVTEGCKTKTTKRFLKRHEGGCKQQHQQLVATKKKLKNVKSELRRKRKTEAKKAAKEKETSTAQERGGESSGAPGSNLIPTGNDQPTAQASTSKSTSTEAQLKARAKRHLSTEAQKEGKKDGDGDQEMEGVENKAASKETLKKRKRVKKAKAKAKENQAPVASGSGVVA